MNTTKTNRFDTVLKSQKRGLALDAIFVLIVAACLLISVVSLSSAAAASWVPATATAEQPVELSIELTAECIPFSTSANDRVC